MLVDQKVLSTETTSSQLSPLLGAILVGLLVWLSPSSAEAFGPAAAEPGGAHPVGVAPYSADPPENKPYRVCPPPTTTRVSCLSAVIPTKNGRPSFGLKGGGSSFTPSLDGSGVEGGFSPADLRAAYNIPETGGKGNTIAVVVAFDYPTAEEDLAFYRNYYGLPPCTSASGCFKKVNQKGETKNYPEPHWGWSLEAALDLDMVSAVCPECNILLVEANNAELDNMGLADVKAVELGAKVVNNSWGTAEFSGEINQNKYFNHPGIPITVAAGDSGYRAEYPAASPYTIAVGGTELRKEPLSSRGWAETVWPGTGSGCSQYETKPTWQKDTKCAKRMIADTAAVASLETPVSVYMTFEWSGWALVGGTSAAAPIIAGIEGLASAATRSMRAEAFYKSPAWLFDIAVGKNGYCNSETEYFCTAQLGYDGPTGNGTPGLILTGKPVVVARAANAKAYEVQLQGTVNPEGLATTYRFEYGLTTAYGERLPLTGEGSAGSGSTSVAVSGMVYGLQEETIYHYRLVASNSKGTTYGEDQTFSTIGSAWVQQPTYSSTFGSVGTGNGQFKEPTSVAVDPKNGNIWVLDSSNSRVQEFKENGEFVRKFGTNGSGDGQFEIPMGIDVDRKGNIWVADTFNDRIQQFDSSGNFVRKFSVPRPQGIAIDSEGHVWVARSLDSFVESYSETGVPLTSFNTTKFPRGIAIDSSGNIWNTTETGYLEKHDQAGKFLGQFGRPGLEPGEFWEPQGLAIDSKDNVWVTNFNHGPFKTSSRIEIYSKGGLYEGSFASLGSGSGQLQYPYDIAVDPRGNAWIADLANNRISKWKVPSQWPPTYSATLGSKGSGNGQFQSPTGTAVNPVNGMLVVADQSNHRIQEFNANGEFIRAFGSKGSGNGQFNEPRGVTVDSKGNIWVADSQNNRIQVFTEKGEFIRAFGTKGSEDGNLYLPWSVAVDSSGNVWVADTFNARIQKFTEIGTYLSKVNYAFSPTAVAVDQQNDVWVAVEPGYIEERNSSGTLLRSFGSNGSGSGQLSSPRALAIDLAGNVWVSEEGNYRVQVFSKTGEYLTKFGTQGSGAGQFNWPVGVAVDPRGFAWIGDYANNRISKWKF